MRLIHHSNSQLNEQKDRRMGFTLTELLVVIAIIAIITSGVISALNIKFTFQKAYDSERKYYVKQIENALYQNLIDGWELSQTVVIPEGAGNAKPICKLSTVGDNTCVILNTLLPTYLACLPYDAAEAIPNYSGYKVYTEVGRIKVIADHMGESTGGGGGGCDTQFIQSNAFSFDPFIGPQGRYIAFESQATNLVAGVMSGINHVYVRDTVGAKTVLASKSGNNVEGNDKSLWPDISDTGRYVVFDSNATNLDPAATNGSRHIFRHDRDTDNNGIFDENGGMATTLISMNDASVQGNSSSFEPVISNDGMHVVFYSKASNFPGDGNGSTYDIFVRDLNTNTTKLLSVRSDGGTSNGVSTKPKVSSNGRFVVFRSLATNLVAEPDTNASADIFVHDRDKDADGIFDETGPGERETTLVSVISGTTDEANAASDNAAISGDGRYVVFTSEATDIVATPGITAARKHVYLHDRQTGTTVLVSKDTSGTAEGDADSSSTGTNWGHQLSISDNGQFLVYTSRATNLIAGDTNGNDDVYLYQLPGGPNTRISITSAGAEATTGHSGFPTISDNGQKISFHSYANDLVPADVNGLPDIFIHDRSTGETTRVNVVNF